MVTRFDPFRDLDRMAERMLSSVADMGQTMRAMPMDVYRSGDHYVLRCDLPGADPGSLDVGVDGRMLTIRAQRSQPEQDVEWLTQERVTGSFARQLTLGDGLDLEHLEATYSNGVLTLTIPLAEEAKPRHIAIAFRGDPTIVGKTESSTAGSIGRQREPGS
ncbi:MAG: Hsp20/alpha crystallin family protein [Actinobacteria bacterium]|nr:Hsp20/alpha crystallin family protein [Actinomycetota bacterium]